MSQASGMHKHPALLGILEGTVVADELAAAALVVDVGVVQRDVDGVGGAVVMGPQEWLLVRAVSHDKVHEGTRRLERKRLLEKQISTKTLKKIFTTISMNSKLI